MANLVEVVIAAKDLASGPIRAVSSSLGILGGAGKGVAGIVGTATTALAGMAVVAGGGLATGIGVAVSQAANFESAIDNVGSLVNATDTQLEQLANAALALGQDISLSGIGASDAAAAMAELAAAGFSVGEMTDGATRGVLLLASATGTAVPVAAQIAGDSFNIFRQAMNLTAADMPRLANLFVGASNVSSIGLTDIGESMKYVGPIAAAMGISIEDVTAAIAALGNQGIKGSEAGTSLRTVIASLSDPSKEARKVMNDLGLSFFDGSGHMKDFAGISEELKSKLSGLTDQQRAAALSTLFGREAMSAATVLYGEGAAGIQKYMQAIEDQGNAAAIGARRNDNLKGAIEALKGAGETALIAFGRGLTPGLQDLATKLAGGVSAAIPFITMLGTRLAGAASVAIDVITRFGSYVSSAIGAVVDAFQKLKGGEITLAQFIGGIKNMIATVMGDLFGGGGGGGASAFIGSIVGVLRQAFPIVVNELAILGRAFGDWVTTTALPWLMPKLGELLAALGGWITGTALPWIGSALVAVGQAFGNWVSATAIPFLQANLPVWLAALGAWITGTALPAVAGWIGAIASAFGTWVSGTAIPYLQANLPLWAQAIYDFLAANIPVLVSNLEMVSRAFADWVKTTAIPYLQANLPEWLAALAGWITGTALPAVGEAMITIAQAFGNWVIDSAVPFLQEKLPAWYTALSGFVNDTVLPGAGNLLLALGAKFGDWITEKAVPYLQEKIPEWLRAITDYLANTALPAIGNKAVELGTALVNKFMDEARKLADQVQTEMGKVPGAITNGIGDLSRLLYQKGVDLVQGLINGIGSMIGAAVQKAKDLAGQVAGAITGLWDQKSPSRLAMGFGRNFVEGLILGMDEKQQEAAKKGAEVASAVAKSVTDILGANRLLARFNFATDAPTGDQLGWFAHLASSLVATLADVAAQFKKEALEQVDDFSDTLSKVGSSVKNAVEGLLAIGKAPWAESSPDGNALAWFAHLASSLVTLFADAAATFAEGALEQAGKLADAASKVGGSVKNTLDGLRALASASWAKVSPDASALGWFTFLAKSLVQSFAQAAADLAEGTTDAASKLGESVGKVAGSIGPALAGLKALAGDVPVPSPAQWDAFFAGVRAVLARFAAMADELKTEGIKQVDDLGAAVASVMGGAKSATDLFKAFAPTKDGKDGLIIPSAQDFDELAEGVKYVVGKFRDMAGMLQGEALTAVTAFSSGVSTIVGAAKAGADLFNSLKKDASWDTKLIDYLVGSIGYAISQIQAIATGIGTEGLAQAQAFATGSLNVFTAIKNALELFPKLLESKDKPADVLAEIWKALEGTLAQSAALVARSDAILQDSITFKANLTQALANFGQGLGMSQGAALALGTAPTIANPWDFSLPGRASGGPVSKGQAYLVGERGPEYFLPQSSGYVLPNGMAPGGGGRGDIVFMPGSIVVQGSVVTKDELTEGIRQALLEQGRRVPSLWGGR